MPEESQLLVSDLLGNARIQTVTLSAMEGHRYVIEKSDFLECQPPLFWHDIIEAEETKAGQLRFIRVTERADPTLVVLELGPHLWCAPVSALGGGRYRLQASQYHVEPPLAYHDVIEAEEHAEARLRFVRLTQKSGLKEWAMTPPPEFVDTAEVLGVLNWLSEHGGYWQRDIALLLSIPKQVETEFDRKWKELADAFRRGLLEAGTADTAGRPFSVAVSLDACHDPKLQADPAIAALPRPARLLFGTPHEGGPLWRLTGEPWQLDKKKPEALDTVSMPPDLKRRIEDWARTGLKARQSGMPPGYSGFADESSERSYLTEGWKLYRELAKVVREPLEFWDFGSGHYRWWAPDAQLEPGDLGKDKDCRVLARTADYALIGRWESAHLLRRGVEEAIDGSLRVGVHDPAVTCGVIAPDQSWCATGGSGVIVYELRPPWEGYDGNRQTDQWFEFERESKVTEMEALDRAYIRLAVSKYGEPIRDRLLDLKTRRLL